MKCSIIKIEESYGGPAVTDSGCEFDPIVALALLPHNRSKSFLKELFISMKYVTEFSRFVFPFLYKSSMNLTLISREIMGGKTYKKILQKGVHSIVLPPTKHFLPIGHALSFEQINSQRWQHGDHRQSSRPTLPVPCSFFKDCLV